MFKNKAKRLGLLRCTHTSRMNGKVFHEHHELTFCKHHRRIIAASREGEVSFSVVALTSHSCFWFSRSVLFFFFFFVFFSSVRLIVVLRGGFIAMLFAHTKQSQLVSLFSFFEFPSFLACFAPNRHTCIHTNVLNKRALHSNAFSEHQTSCLIKMAPVHSLPRQLSSTH